MPVLVLNMLSLRQNRLNGYLIVLLLLACFVDHDFIQ
uniref:Uncharacterized protein n=1 Tax=Arundo donax TaxID=35708 RepID=A0A0A8YE67_ARUDO